jgi:hypothetical protein
MNFDEPDYICKECYGRKITDARIMIGRVCPACNGEGKKDWISHAMNERTPYEPPDHQFLHNLIMRNIQMLVNEIHIQALELEISADVSVEFKTINKYKYKSDNIKWGPLVNKKIKSP